MRGGWVILFIATRRTHLRSSSRQHRSFACLRWKSAGLVCLIAMSTPPTTVFSTLIPILVMSSLLWDFALLVLSRCSYFDGSALGASGSMGVPGDELSPRDLAQKSRLSRAVMSPVRFARSLIIAVPTLSSKFQVLALLSTKQSVLSDSTEPLSRCRGMVAHSRT